MTNKNEESTSYHQPRNRWMGLILVLTAVLGWLLSTGGLAGLWLSHRPVKQTILDMLNLASGSIESTYQILAVLDDSLVQAERGLRQVNATLNNFSNSLEGTTQILAGISNILSSEFDQILSNTVTSMEALEKTSVLIDNTLAFVSAIPFFGGSQYKPEVPLSQSVAGIKKDLQEMPRALDNVSQQLDSTSESLSPIPQDLNSMGSQLSQIETNLADARSILSDYKISLASFQSQITTLKKSLPLAIDTAYGVLTLLLVWIGLAQFGLFTQGLERLRPQRNA